MNLTKKFNPYGKGILSFLCTTAVCGTALGITATQASAAGFLGNISSTTPGTALLFGSTTTISLSQAKAVNFLTPTTGTYSLGNVYLALSNFDDGDVEQIFVRQNGPLGSPSVQLALVAPAKTQDNSAKVWEFAPVSSFNLSANTTYSLVLGSTVGDFTWGREGLSATTPTGTATFSEYVFSGTNGLAGPFALSPDPDNTNSFQINTTAVPEPNTILSLVALGISGLFVGKKYPKNR